MKNREQIELLDQKLAPVMFILSLVFILLIAAILHVPELMLVKLNQQIELGIITCFYCVFLAELMHVFFLGGRITRLHYLACLFPFLRFACSDHVDGDRIWLPGVGWRERDIGLSSRLQHLFSGPMIVIALIVLPLILIEFFWARAIEANTPWYLTINILTGLIWFAFTFEFILLISLVEKKLHYCLTHWLDLLVILLPLTAILRAARLTQLMRLQKVSRSVRLFRVRGLAMRAWRAVLALNLLNILLMKSPENQLASLEQKLADHQHEVARMKEQIEKLRDRIATENSQSEDLCT